MMDLDASIRDTTLAFMDVETTGLRPEFGDRVCEVAVLRCRGNQVLGAYEQLVNPRRPMGAGALRVHGISDAMLRGAPTFGEIADDLLAALKGAVFVGHNAPFDLGFLSSELALVRRHPPPLIALDTLRLARRNVTAPSYSLGRLCRALGITWHGSRHRAMGDVLATRALLGWMIEQLWPRGMRSLGDYVRAQGGALKQRRPAAADVPAPLRQALQEDHLLRLRYRSAGGRLSDRVIRPLQIYPSQGTLFIVAYCYLREASRTFRLDRIEAMELITDTDSP